MLGEHCAAGYPCNQHQARHSIGRTGNKKPGRARLSIKQTTGLSAARHLDAALGLGLVFKELERPGLELRLSRCVQPGLFLAALFQLGNVAAAVEH